jgi:hypothetical protein
VIIRYDVMLLVWNALGRLAACWLVVMMMMSSFCGCWEVEISIKLERVEEMNLDTQERRESESFQSS